MHLLYSCQSDFTWCYKMQFMDPLQSRGYNHSFKEGSDDRPCFYCENLCSHWHIFLDVNWAVNDLIPYWWVVGTVHDVNLDFDSSREWRETFILCYGFQLVSLALRRCQHERIKQLNLQQWSIHAPFPINSGQKTYLNYFLKYIWVIRNAKRSLTWINKTALCLLSILENGSWKLINWKRDLRDFVNMRSSYLIWI